MIAGIILVIYGILIYYDGNIFKWFGNSSGDIKIEIENFRMYFPIMSGVILIILFSLIFWVIRFFYGNKKGCLFEQPFVFNLEYQIIFLKTKVF